jgi:hypothetical protein
MLVFVFVPLLKRAMTNPKDRGDIVRGNVLFAFDPLVMSDSKMHGIVQV